MKTILAIGGHIGDMELTAGGIMASNAIKGGKNITLALTAGERGNPAHLTPAEYRVQKVKEAETFAKMVNGEAIVLKYCDGELPMSDEVVNEIVEIIVKYKPNVIVTHWKSTMHRDHNNTHLLVQEAQFRAGVVGNKDGIRHYAPLYFCENWEDSDDFVPYVYVDITDGYELWKEAIQTHWFIMNSKDFKYFDYYTSLARCRGALMKKQYAECFAVHDRQKKIFKEEL